jgi:hypothetical protein
MADELEVQIHLAGMEARDRWRALEPRLAEVEKAIARSGQRAGEIVERELSAIGTALRKLLDDVRNPKP